MLIVRVKVNFFKYRNTKNPESATSAKVSINAKEMKNATYKSAQLGQLSRMAIICFPNMKREFVYPWEGWEKNTDAKIHKVMVQQARTNMNANYRQLNVIAIEY